MSQEQRIAVLEKRVEELEGKVADAVAIIEHYKKCFIKLSNPSMSHPYGHGTRVTK